MGQYHAYACLAVLIYMQVSLNDAFEREHVPPRYFFFVQPYMSTLLNAMRVCFFHFFFLSVDGAL